MIRISVIKNFKRTEKKYIISSATYLSLREKLGSHVIEDEYGWDTICSLYFDTENFDLIRRSIDKPVYKEKLRLRSYNVPTADKKVYVELKKKYDGIVYKRRISLKYSDALNFLQSGDCDKIKQKDKQIANELLFAISRYSLKPAMVVCYDRLALVCPEDPDVRITFDTSIRARDYELDLLKGSHGWGVLDKDKYIMEIKVNSAMPLWLVHALRECEIRPGSFSKYGTAYKQKLKLIDVAEQ
ncbi:MAG: polyphosphate polymerase domain-containing protein [Clostridia bacterium]|nr:polyphosphate polymerase domain-containing protein [Clostridia bacterium]